MKAVIKICTGNVYVYTTIVVISGKSQEKRALSKKSGWQISPVLCGATGQLFGKLKMKFETGQIVVQSMNGIQGIVLEHKTTPHNSYYNKVIIYCTFAPHNSSLVGQALELSASGLKVKDEKSV
jgi:hypothetical protein